MKRFFLITCLLLSAMLAQPVMAAGSNAGEGRWVNPISDVCWKCLFPMTLGSIPLASGPQPDTTNPASPIQICPVGILYRIGLAIGFWEPMAMTDVTREPGVMVNMGASRLTWEGPVQARQDRVTGLLRARSTTSTGINIR
jgi:conjugal transfer pilus assembly protein TraU